MDNRTLIAASALVAIFTGQVGACPLEDCLPGLSEPQFQSRDDMLGLYDLRQSGQAAMHVGLIAADFRIALLETENRALRLALATGTPLDVSSLKFYPSLNSFLDAMKSDLIQTETTGRMPQLRHFEQRVRNADTRAKIADASRALVIESAQIAAAANATKQAN
jgi:hypothetical protein